MSQAGKVGSRKLNKVHPNGHASRTPFKPAFEVCGPLGSGGSDSSESATGATTVPTPGSTTTPSTAASAAAAARTTAATIASTSVASTEKKYHVDKQEHEDGTASSRGGEEYKPVDDDPAKGLYAWFTLRNRLWETEASWGPTRECTHTGDFLLEKVEREDYDLRCVWETTTALSIACLLTAALLYIVTVRSALAEPLVTRNTERADGFALPELAVVTGLPAGYSFAIQRCSVENTNLSSLVCEDITSWLEPCSVDLFANEASTTERTECLNNKGDQRELRVRGYFGTPMYRYVELSVRRNSTLNESLQTSGTVGVLVKDMSVSDTEPLWSYRYYSWISAAELRLTYEVFFDEVHVKRSHAVHGLGSGVVDIVSAKYSPRSFVRAEDVVHPQLTQVAQGFEERVPLRVVFMSSGVRETVVVQHYNLLQALADFGGIWTSLSTLYLWVAILIIGSLKYICRAKRLPQRDRLTIDERSLLLEACRLLEQRHENLQRIPPAPEHRRASV